MNPEWANRRRLLTAAERLTPERFSRMWNAVADGDPTGQIIAAHIAKEHLCALLGLVRARPTRDMISNARYRFGAWCALFAHVPEIVTLAETIDTWWPEIEAFLRLNITNARTEGSNRTIKQSFGLVGEAAADSLDLRTPYPRLRDRTGRGVINQTKVTPHPEPRRAVKGAQFSERHRQRWSVLEPWSRHRRTVGLPKGKTTSADTVLNLLEWRRPTFSLRSRRARRRWSAGSWFGIRPGSGASRSP